MTKKKLSKIVMFLAFITVFISFFGNSVKVKAWEPVVKETFKGTDTTIILSPPH